MRAEWTFMRIAGIPIRAHVTLILFLPVMVWLFSRQIADLAGIGLVDADADAVEGAFGGAGALAAGAAIAVGLFASVLLHELGHAVEARRHKLPVRSITLWLFGGIARLENVPRRPRIEALVAIAGPVVSFALAGLGLLSRALIVDPWSGFTVAYLGYVNLSLGLFNLIPAFPLDGGRLLRAGLAARMDYVRATNLASTVGKGFAVLLGFAGLLQPGGFFLIFIALFIYMGASQEAAGVELANALDPIPVAAVMDREPPVVTPELTLDDVTARMFASNRTGFPVTQDGHVVGVITLSDVRKVDAALRPTTRVADAMSRELLVVDMRATATQALRLMAEHSVGRLLVVGHDGHLEGLVTREGLLRAFEIARTHPVVRW